MKKTFLLLTILTIILASCTAPKTPFARTAATATVDQIVFLVLKIQKDTPKNKITLISTTKTTGKIKAKPQKPDAYDYLTIEASIGNELYQTSYYEHPLYKNVEYADEQNQLISKFIEGNEEEFFIRLQTKTGSNKIRIYETRKNKPKQELLTLTI